MNNNNIFGDLLKIKTGKEDLIMKAVYVSNSTSAWYGTYFIYYYDLLNHTFYINDLDKQCDYRTSAINIIEHIINEAYRQEMDSLNPIVKKIQTSKKPKIINIYKELHTWYVIIDTVILEAIKKQNGEIIAFKNPKWERSLENILDMLNSKKS